MRVVARLLVVLAAVAGDARAEDAKPTPLPDQSIGAAIGIAAGGRVTPGGVRVTGHYLYQLSQQDWFDSSAVFTFGSPDAACFRDRQDAVICDHGFVDGAGVELSAGVRRMFPPQGQFRPFARVAVGLAVMRFGEDRVTGAGVPVHLGGGVRADVSDGIAIVASGELLVGFAGFNRGLGLQPQASLAITAGAEFRLK